MVSLNDPLVSMVVALAPLLLALTVIIITMFMTGPLTKMSWYAEDGGELIVMYHYDDLVVRPTIPEFMGAGLVKLRTSAGDVLIHVHPRSVLNVHGSPARLLWVYAWSPIAIPPQYIGVAYDLKHQGYSTLSTFLNTAVPLEELEKTRMVLEETIKELRVGDERVAREGLRQIYGDKVDEMSREQLLKLATTYAEELDKNLRELRLLEEQVRKAKTKGVAPVCVRTYTPEDVKSWLPALAPPTALTNVYEYAKMAALKELRMFSSPIKIPWMLLILLVIILFVAVIALPHLQSIIQGGAQAVGQAVSTVPPLG
jgi:cell division protein FtsB